MSERSVLRKASLQVEVLEDRMALSANVPDVNLSSHGASGVINGAIFGQMDAQRVRRNDINPFVRLDRYSCFSSVEQGYNTDERPLQFDELRDRRSTHSLRLGEVPEVTVGGVKYREFLLDINEKSSQPLLSLDELRVYVGNRGDLSGYNASTKKLAGVKALYDLDAGGNHWVKLDARLNRHHPGRGDARVLIPSSAFAGAAASSFVYLYSKFGLYYSSSGAFEEWSVRKTAPTPPPPPPPTSGTISGHVFYQPDLEINQFVGLPEVTVFIDANDNGDLDDGEQSTVSDGLGAYSLTGLGFGQSYRVRQLVPDDYTQLSQDPALVALDAAHTSMTGVDFINFRELGGGGF